MITYQLRCDKEHEFEGWFADSSSCDSQLDGHAVECPYCGSVKVSKSIMAPRIAKGASRKSVSVSPAKEAAQLKQALRELRDQVEQNCDYVGDQFAEEARKIHYGEADSRGIYGESSEKEATELADEGIEVSRIPWLPRDDA